MTGIVAIVGRPNVGKSTLFNRLVGRQQAIVEDVAGTTRDRLYANIESRDRTFTLVDTGGLETGPESEISRRVQEQVELAVREADVVIFMVDTRDGITITDKDIAEALRRSAKPVVLAVNKVDNARDRLAVNEFYELGTPIPISAYHNTGIGDMMDALLRYLPKSEPVQETGLSRIAILGRPNVGKSALLNAILGEERVIVSEVPGTTRDAIDTIFEYAGRRMVFVDTAGIRRRGSIERGVEKYSVLRAMNAINRADVTLLVLDAGELVAAQDTHIAGYIIQESKGIIVVVNKWDLAKELGLDKEETQRKVKYALRFIPYAPILFVSAKEHEGIEDILAEEKLVIEERNKRIPTARLNDVVGKAVLEHRPPSGTRSLLKILYVTQAEVNPPTFVFSVNNPELVHFSYRRYLENRIRQTFGFTGTPIRFIFKKRGE